MKKPRIYAVIAYLLIILIYVIPILDKILNELFSLRLKAILLSYLSITPNTLFSTTCSPAYSIDQLCFAFARINKFPNLILISQNLANNVFIQYKGEKMSTNTNKQNGKRKGLPKLKTILANPFQEKCPSLKDDELQELVNLLKEVISKSGLEPQPFVTSRHIHLGLESSLRAINNFKCSCVLISRSIQPRILVRLIARNVEAKNATVPVFVQNQLENVTKNVFGIKALCVVFPTVDEMKETNMDDSIIQWITAHTKQLKPETVKKPKNKKIQRKIPAIEDCKQPPVVDVQTQEIKNITKSNDGFISFTEGKEVAKADSIEYEKHLFAVLNKVAERVGKHATTEQYDEMKAADTTQQMEEKRVDTFSDSDDFLPDIYQPLTVHKIQPNPNRKPKKKIQKKNKQNKN
ncbi:PREDICTED: uncharacterized protein LOC108975722 [Bactrocera latifrons]|uniref:Uncharacterized protein n=1 Tax=Bactrocera latifrons TaxID=174628 RepID=A0A0K8VM01_BACLA|nr:PREDICTED: uncharacterized protein LOC108975722 [Bactrocera latifrons]